MYPHLYGKTVTWPKQCLTDPNGRRCTVSHLCTPGNSNTRKNQKNRCTHRSHKSEKYATSNGTETYHRCIRLCRKGDICNERRPTIDVSAYVSCNMESLRVSYVLDAVTRTSTSTRLHVHHECIQNCNYSTLLGREQLPKSGICS